MRRIGVLTAFAESDDEAPRYAAPLRMASKHTGRRRRPTPEITSSVLDFHSWSLPCCNAQRYFAMQYGVLRMRESGEVPVFGRFGANSKVFLHRPERRRLALA